TGRRQHRIQPVPESDSGLTTGEAIRLLLIVSLARVPEVPATSAASGTSLLRVKLRRAEPGVVLPGVLPGGCRHVLNVVLRQGSSRKQRGGQRVRSVPLRRWQIRSLPRKRCGQRSPRKSAPRPDSRRCFSAISSRLT
ncbi:MAG: hypothetical protein JJU36_04310, partial [Phycisphaeraceae bacterium]|nr:hypothetical protein [Phycisphaeraceae bacterium]